MSVDIIDSQNFPTTVLSLTFFQTGDKDEEIATWLYRKTNEEHTYTNIVAFDGDYDLDGDGLPEHIRITNNGAWTNLTHTENHLSQSGSVYWSLPENEAVKDSDELFVSYPANTGHVVKKILVYQDVFFMVFGSHGGLWAVKDEDKEVARVDRKYSLYTTFLYEGNVSGNSIDVPMANLRLPGENGKEGLFLYADSSHYLAKQKENESPDVWDPEGVEGSSDEIPQTEEPLQMIGEDAETIPRRHRWIEFAAHHLRGGEHISRYWNYVMLVDSHSIPHIREIISAHSDYARYTGYWEIYNWTGQATGANRKPMLVKDDEDFPIKSVRNLFLQPVWKPYSEVDLVVYQGTVDGQTVFDKKEYQYFTSRLKKNFESEDGVCRRKKFFIDATKNSNEFLKTLERYAKTPSPFKCEIWCTKGNRLEYNAGGGNVIGNGITTLAISKTSGITPEMFKKLHDTCNYWYENFSLFLYIAAGFGAGIQQGESSASQGTALPSADDLAPGINNLFYIVGCCASTPSQGVMEGDVVSGPEFMLLQKCMRKSKTYQGICQSFNNLVSNLTTKTYMLIDKFFDDTYDIMQEVAISSKASLWEASKQLIKNDILTNGKKYFIVNDYVPEDSANYAASDNFISLEDGRKWRIHDGFVGYVKQHVFPSMVCDQRKTNQIEYFDNDGLFVLASEKKFKTIADNIRRLHIDVDSTFSNQGIHYDYQFLAITHPRCECIGKFANDNAEFLKEPGEFARNWLSSDNDIVQLKEKYMQDAMNA